MPNPYIRWLFVIGVFGRYQVWSLRLVNCCQRFGFMIMDRNGSVIFTESKSPVTLFDIPKAYDQIIMNIFCISYRVCKMTKGILKIFRKIL